MCFSGKSLWGQIGGEQPGSGGETEAGHGGGQEATAIAEGRSVRLEQQGSRQGRTPDRRLTESTGWLAGGMRGVSKHTWVSG